MRHWLLVTTTYVTCCVLQLGIESTLKYLQTRKQWGRLYSISYWKIPVCLSVCLQPHEYKTAENSVVWWHITYEVYFLHIIKHHRLFLRCPLHEIHISWLSRTKILLSGHSTPIESTKCLRSVQGRQKNRNGDIFTNTALCHEVLAVSVEVSDPSFK